MSLIEDETCVQCNTQCLHCKDKEEKMITPKPYIFGICVAYEQGVGKGRDGRKKDNPYTPGHECEAWDYGWQEGNLWFTKQKLKENTGNSAERS